MTARRRNRIPLGAKTADLQTALDPRYAVNHHSAASAAEGLWLMCIECVLLSYQAEGRSGTDSREVIRALTRDGWYEVNRVGSHKQFKHPTKKGRARSCANSRARLSPPHVARHASSQVSSMVRLGLVLAVAKPPFCPKMSHFFLFWRLGSFRPDIQVKDTAPAWGFWRSNERSDCCIEG